MSCGIEGMVLALQLAKELVDKPWKPYNDITTVYTPAVYIFPRPPWEQARKDAESQRQSADFQEAHDKKLREFEQMTRMCLDKSGTGTVTSDSSPGGITFYGSKFGQWRSVPLKNGTGSSNRTLEYKCEQSGCAEFLSDENNGTHVFPNAPKLTK